MDLYKILSSLFSAAFGARRYTVSQATEDKIKRDWANIDTLLAQKGASQLKQALITADKTLDNVLKDLFAGETMAERLKAAKDRFDPVVYNKIWEAHKIRNNLVHEAGYEPPYFVLTEAVGKLRSGLRALGVRV